MKIAVVYAPGPRQAREWLLDLPEGSCVQDALNALDSLKVREAQGAPDTATRDEPPALPKLSDPALQLGIWGRACERGQVLKAQDRVEIYRELRVDPKVARRERFTGQGVRGAGLFARKRAGGKAGY